MVLDSETISDPIQFLHIYYVVLEDAFKFWSGPKDLDLRNETLSRARA